MRRSFYIHHKPFSINAYWYGDRRHKTSAARDWESSMFFELSKPEAAAALKDLRETFDKTKHAYVVKLISYYPKNIFYTAAGTISAKTFDVTNWEKPLIDLIFLAKHFDQPELQGCQNLNTDDKYLIRLTSSKQPWEHKEHAIYVQIAIVNFYP